MMPVNLKRTSSNHITKNLSRKLRGHICLVPPSLLMMTIKRAHQFLVRLMTLWRSLPWVLESVLLKKIKSPRRYPRNLSRVDLRPSAVMTESKTRVLVDQYLCPRLRLSMRVLLRVYSLPAPHPMLLLRPRTPDHHPQFLRPRSLKVHLLLTHKGILFSPSLRKTQSKNQMTPKRRYPCNTGKVVISKSPLSRKLMPSCSTSTRTTLNWASRRRSNCRFGTSQAQHGNFRSPIPPMRLQSTVQISSPVVWLQVRVPGITICHLGYIRLCTPPSWRIRSGIRRIRSEILLSASSSLGWTQAKARLLVTTGKGPSVMTNKSSWILGPISSMAGLMAWSTVSWRLGLVLLRHLCKAFSEL